MEHKKTNNKRGVSPLIASVLLIAFTVAIGAIIMTWGRGFIQAQTDKVNTESTGSTACSTSVNFEFLKIDNIKEVCYQENGFVNFTLNNIGTENILGFKVQILDNNGNLSNSEINVGLNSGEALKYALSYSSTSQNGVKSLSLSPIIRPAGLGANRTCNNFRLEASNLISC